MTLLLVSNIVVLLFFIFKLNRLKLKLHRFSSYLNWRTYGIPEFVLSVNSRGSGDYNSESRKSGFDNTRKHHIDIPNWYIMNRRRIANPRLVDYKGAGDTISERHWFKTNRDINLLREKITTEERSIILRSKFEILAEEKSADYYKLVVRYNNKNFVCNKHSIIFYCCYSENIVKETYSENGWVFITGLYKRKVDKFDKVIKDKYIYKFSKNQNKIVHSILSPVDKKRELKIWDFFPLLFQIINVEKIIIYMNFITTIYWVVFPYVRHYFNILISNLFKKLERKIIISYIDRNNWLGKNFTLIKDENRSCMLLKAKKLNIFNRMMANISNKYLKINLPCDNLENDFYKADEPIVMINNGLVPDSFEMVKCHQNKTKIKEVAYKLICNYYKLKIEMRRIIFKEGISSIVENSTINELIKLRSKYPHTLKVEGDIELTYGDKNTVKEYREMYSFSKFIINYKFKFVKKYFEKWKLYKRRDSHQRHLTIKVNQTCYGRSMNEFTKSVDPAFVTTFLKKDRLFMECFKNDMCGNTGVHINSNGGKNKRAAVFTDMLTKLNKGGSMYSKDKLHICTFGVKETENLIERYNLCIINRKHRIYYSNDCSEKTIHIRGYRGGIVGDTGNFRNNICFRNKNKGVLVGYEGTDFNWIGFYEETNRSINNYVVTLSLYKFLQSENLTSDRILQNIFTFINKKSAFIKMDKDEIGNARWKCITSEISSYLKERLNMKFYYITPRPYYDGRRIKEIEKGLELETKIKYKGMFSDIVFEEEDECTQKEDLEKEIEEKARKLLRSQDDWKIKQGKLVRYREIDNDLSYQKALNAVMNKLKGNDSKGNKSINNIAAQKLPFKDRIDQNKIIKEYKAIKDGLIGKLKLTMDKKGEEQVENDEKEKKTDDMMAKKGDRKNPYIELFFNQYKEINEKVKVKVESSSKLSEVEKVKFAELGVKEKVETYLEKVNKFIKAEENRENEKSKIGKEEEEKELITEFFETISHTNVNVNRVGNNKEGNSLSRMVKTLDGMNKNNKIKVKVDDFIKYNKPVRVGLISNVIPIECENPFEILSEEVANLDIEEMIQGELLRSIEDISTKTERKMKEKGEAIENNFRRMEERKGGKKIKMKKLKLITGVKKQVKTFTEFGEILNKGEKIFKINNLEKAKKNLVEEITENLNSFKRNLEANIRINRGDMIEKEFVIEVQHRDQKVMKSSYYKPLLQSKFNKVRSLSFNKLCGQIYGFIRDNVEFKKVEGGISVSKIRWKIALKLSSAFIFN